MKYAKRLVSLFLLLAVTAGSVFAFDTPAIQSISVNDSTATVQNPNPKITSVKLDPDVGGNTLAVRTNFQMPFDENSESPLMYRDESPLVYRSVNNKTFKVVSTSTNQHFYAWEPYPKQNTQKFVFYDNSCKNGVYYRYKFSTMLRNSSTGKWSPIARSNIKSFYFLDPMNRWDMRVKNSKDNTAMTVSWKRNSKADGYMLYYAYIQKNGKAKWFTRKIKGNKTTKFTLKNRTPNKQYYIQMRSYKKYNGKTYYSDYSDTMERY